MRSCTFTLALVVVALASSTSARADAVTDWNARAAALVSAEKMPAAYAYRAMAIAQVASEEAVNAASSNAASRWTTVVASGAASLDAALAAANRSVLDALLPGRRSDVDRAYREVLTALPDGDATRAGVALGERIGAALLERAASDGFASAPAFRVETVPGAWQATTAPVAAQWPLRKAWLIGRADRFRPGAPPALESKRWASDLAEIKAIGASASTLRTPEQTEIARFWEATTPAVYFELVRSVAELPGRSLASNARLLALVATAMDDALIAVFDAKYHYAFWRPISAIHNADRDGNDATTADAGWTPLIETPMHPEYPCAHCILAAAVGTVLADEPGIDTTRLHATSPTLPGVERRWQSIGAFVAEVANARVYAGVHFRNSTEVGATMGAQVGKAALADAHFARAAADVRSSTVAEK
jgi:hypothetical protein